ncbi:MAG: ABC transporter substrate-binding protein [Clostridiales bacterium]|nr:ABC transporter substrate-binding protein [Clostridiales bacterium]
MKKTVALVLTSAMVMGLIAGCQSSENNESQGAKDNGTSSSPAASEADSSGTDEASNEDMAEIILSMFAMGEIPKDVQLVEDGINKITEPEINVHVTLDVLESGNYAQQVSLRMSGQEKMDIMLTNPSGAVSFANMFAANQLTPLGDLMEEYGQDILATLGELANSMKVGGDIYGLPRNASMVSSDYICMRTDILEELGLLEKAQNMTSFTEFEEILAAVKENYDLAPIVASSGGTVLSVAGVAMKDKFEDCTSVDVLNDTMKILSVEPGTTTVKNFFATDDYAEMAERVRGWYEKGYVYKDSTTTTDNAESIVKQNGAFSWISTSEIGVEAAKRDATGYDITCVKIDTHIIGTSNCTKFAWVVPITSDEPEAAMKVLNLMYKDGRISTLLAWGVEGTHYVLDDEGVAHYPEGVTAENCGYHTVDFLVPNQLEVPVWEGAEPDLREQAKAEMETAPISQFLGFTMDSTQVSNEVSALLNCLDEYMPMIESGVGSEADLAQFLEKLNSSGVDKYVSEAQKQLDEWLQQQK